MSPTNSHLPPSPCPLPLLIWDRRSGDHTGGARERRGQQQSQTTFTRSSARGRKTTRDTRGRHHRRTQTGADGRASPGRAWRLFASILQLLTSSNAGPTRRIGCFLSPSLFVLQRVWRIRRPHLCVSSLVCASLVSPSLSLSQVIIVGGGLAGLSAAHTVVERGGRALVLDKKVRPRHRLERQRASTAADRTCLNER